MGIYEYWIVTNNRSDNSVNLSKIVGDKVHASREEAQTVCDRHNKRLKDYCDQQGDTDIDYPFYRVVSVTMCYDPDNKFFDYLDRFEDSVSVDG